MIRSMISSLCAGLCVALLLVPTTKASAQEFTLRIGSVAPKGTPWSALVNREKKRIQSESGGRIKVKTYLGGKLGSDFLGCTRIRSVRRWFLGHEVQCTSPRRPNHAAGSSLGRVSPAGLR